MTNAAKALWIATVEHVSCPGTTIAAFYQRGEPSDRAIKNRFTVAGVIKPSELEITGLFDLSHACRHDPASLKAIEEFDNANTRAAWKANPESAP